MKEVNFVNLVNFAAGTLCEGLRVTVSYYLLIEDIYRMSNLGGFRGSDGLTVSVLGEVHQVHQVHRNGHQLRDRGGRTVKARRWARSGTGEQAIRGRRTDHGPRATATATASANGDTEEGRAKCPRDAYRTNALPWVLGMPPTGRRCRGPWSSLVIGFSKWFKMQSQG